MKLTHYIYLSTALATLAACSDDIDPVYTVGEADNAIVLQAGVGEGTSALTRADGDTPNVHVPFANTTQLRLYVEGTWAGKTPSTTITQYTNCLTSDATDRLDGASTDDNDIHPLMDFTPQLFWDDYGTADPNNVTNRANGLAVYGVGVDGLVTLPDDLKAIVKGESSAPDSWTSLAWSVKTDGADVLSKDIIVSNNHGDNSNSTKTGIKFDNRNSKTENLLIFEHMMSKITFILTAGDGFANGFFSKAPEVVLTRNKHGETSETEYCYTEGTVNIKAASATGTTLGTVKLQVKDASNLGKVTEHALVFPGSNFGAADADVIARINADGNIYYVTAEKIRAAIADDDKTTKKGTNYIIKVKVNKTGIKVTATVKEWVDIETTEVETPVIDVNTPLGGAGVAATEAFSFYRSTSLDNGYSTTSSSLLVDEKYYKEEAVVSLVSSKWTMSPQLFWPNHDTHFQFRGVYPRTATAASATDPLVYMNTDNFQVIDINNAAYSSTTFPSNLMIARPDVAEGAKCDNKEPDHTKTNLYSGGICANEGTINMQFHYIMSQVEVRLTTSEGDDRVNLTNAKVEIVGGYTDGYVKLGTLEAVPITTGSYTLDLLPAEASARDGIDAANIRHSSIVPQTLTYNAETPLAETNLRFKITIYSSDPEGKPDIYYADIQPIRVKVKGSSDTAAPVSAWESGKHYIYTLNILKTKISIKATIADWITLEGTEDVWL